MTARPTGPREGVIFCDVKVPEGGTCKAEFPSHPNEEYYLCLARAQQEGWKVRIGAHACPKHAGLYA